MGVEVKASVLAAVVACGVALGAPLEVEAGWAEVEKIELAAPSDNAQAGAALDIEGDRLVLGAGNQRVGEVLGAAYVFERDAAGAWVQVAELLPDDGGFPDFFGSSVSLDGDRVLVGARSASGGAAQSGAAYVFERDATGAWAQVAKLTHPGAQGDRFGQAVQLDGDTALVSAPQGEGDVAGAGAVYVFARDAAGTWSQTQRLVSPTGADGQFFGFVMSLDGDRALVTAPRDGNGVAHVFARDAAGQWEHEARIDPPASPPRRDVDDFARSVSLSGDRALVGDPKGTLRGLARVYERDAAGAWVEVAALESQVATAGDFFGEAVALSGDRAVVGSAEDDAGEDAGAVYVFERDAAGAWVEAARLNASDAQAEDRFGDALAISGARVAAGAYLVDGAESNSGAVYILESSPSANPDAVSTDEDTPVTFDPLANDVVDAGATVGGLAGFSAGGGATVGAAGAVTYTPAPEFSGQETFTYTITQGADVAMGVVTVTVAPVNDAPVGVDGQAEVAAGESVTITLMGRDTEGDALTFSVNPPLNGEVTGAGPEVVYTPAEGFVGVDTFTFVVSDGQDDSEPTDFFVIVLAGDDEADAGAGGDAGVGAPDAGAGEGDAGGAGGDAGSGGGDAGAGPAPGGGGQDAGCCATAPTRPRAPALAWLALIGLVGAVRRRRAGR
jgi:hypothetical protein